ncbi:MAG: TonB-dependent receptor [Gammaproteobacteria bacterium]
MADATHTLTFAFEREREEFVQRGIPSFFGDPNQDQDTTNIGYVGEYRLGVWDQVFLSGAVRHDDNDAFEDATTYRATAAYIHPSWSTKLHGSYGTGVKNPSFTERFGFTPESSGNFFGNPKLEPEKSEGWEIGIEQPLFQGRLTAGATYFDEQLEDEINGFFFDPTLGGPFGGFTAVNMDGESERRGVELILAALVSEGLSLKGAYTYTDSTQPDEMTGRDVREIRRPEHVASLAANYRFLADRANINLTVEYTGEQIDNDFSTVPATRVTLDDYTLVNLTVSYALHEKARVFGRVENLLDEDYQDVFGFETPGIGGFLGLEVGLDLM